MNTTRGFRTASCGNDVARRSSFLRTLGLEQLESKRVLATILWDFGSDSFPTAWQGGGGHVCNDADLFPWSVTNGVLTGVSKESVDADEPDGQCTWLETPWFRFVDSPNETPNLRLDVSYVSLFGGEKATDEILVALVNEATREEFPLLFDLLQEVLILPLNFILSETLQTIEAEIEDDVDLDTRYRVRFVARDYDGEATIGQITFDNLEISSVAPRIVLPVKNIAPTISHISDSSTAEDTPIGAIPFTIGDDATAAAALNVTVTSDNQSVIPSSNILLSGNDALRSMAITPLPDAFGSATISVTVTDEEGKSSTESFLLTLDPVNDAPTISPVSNANTVEDVPITNLPFTLNDIDTAPSSLVVTASSDNQAIISDANISVLGLGLDRLLNIAPSANQFGTARITVQVIDTDSKSASTVFDVTVSPQNDAPTLVLPIGSLTVDEDANATSIGVSAAFGDADNESLTFSIPSISNNNVLDASITGGLLTVDYLKNQHGKGSIVVRAQDPAGAFVEDVINVTVNAVNDAPVNQLPGMQTTSEDTPLIFSSANGNAMTLSDVDAAGGMVSAVVSVDSGSLRLATTSGLTSFGADGTQRVTLQGPLSAINGALNGLEFMPAQSFTGLATLTLESNDAGHVGSGGPQSDLDTLTVVVNKADQPPTASFDPVTPNPRAAVVDQVLIRFSEPVHGFDVGDLSLTRQADGIESVTLDTATLTKQDETTWTLTNLTELTRASGIYLLTIDAVDATVQDVTGNSVDTSAAAQWIHGAGDANRDLQFNQFDVIALLQAGLYRKNLPATWQTGDFDGDGRFTQFDLILAQQTSPSHYRIGPFAAVRNGN